MSKPSILLQLDTDAQCSVFDSVVAIDAGSPHLLRHGGITPEIVQSLVHGAIFTRAVEELKNTAIFVGGSDVSAGEKLLEAIRASFFGPMRVSVMLDSGGANTTAAAAVLASKGHLSLAASKALVLGSTGPVGNRIVRMLAASGAEVRAGSRGLQRAEAVCDAVRLRVPRAKLTPVITDSTDAIDNALDDVDVVFAAGAAGVSLLPAEIRKRHAKLTVAIDLNAVPPVGIEGIEVTDRGKKCEGAICYGAIGVGGVKMKLHKACIRKLFQKNDLVLDAEEILDLAIALDH